MENKSKIILKFEQRIKELSEFKNKNNSPSLLSKTTLVAFCYEEGLILASDGRVSGGSLIFSDKYEKVLVLENNILISFSGSVSDAQLLYRYCNNLILEMKEFYEESYDVDSFALFLSNILSKNNLYIGILIGGINNSNIPKIYEIESDGSLLESKYLTSGSGSIFIYSLLDKEYKESLKEEEAISLAKLCINSAKNRDIYSGGSICIYLLNKQGILNKILIS